MLSQLSRTNYALLKIIHLLIGVIDDLFQFTCTVASADSMAGLEPVYDRMKEAMDLLDDVK